MKRTAIAILIALAFAGVGASALGRTYLPVVPAQTVNSAPFLLQDGDHGFVSVAQVGGHWYVGYQTRPDGRLHIAEDVGAALVDVPSPLARSLLPSFDAEGPKQGSASLASDGPYLRIYYTGRAPGDPTGPFKLWRVVMQP